MGRRLMNLNWLSNDMYHDFQSIIFCEANMVTLLPNRLIILNSVPCWLYFVTFVSLPCLGSKWLSMAIRFTHVCEHKSIEYAKYRQMFYTKKEASTKQSTTEKENKKSYPSKFNRTKSVHIWQQRFARLKMSREIHQIDKCWRCSRAIKEKARVIVIVFYFSFLFFIEYLSNLVVQTVDIGWLKINKFWIWYFINR